MSHQRQLPKPYESDLIKQYQLTQKLQQGLDGMTKHQQQHWTSQVHDG